MKRLTGILFAAILAVIFSSCSASPGSGPSTAAASRAPSAAAASYPSDIEAPAAEAAAPPPADMAPEADFDAVYDAYDSEGLSGSLPILTPGNDHEALLSYEAELHLQTTEFMAGSRLLLNTASELGGYSLYTYIEGRAMFAEDSLRSARYDLRIPSSKLSEFLIKMEESFNLLMLRQSSQDITAQYGEADTRMADLKEQEARLLESIAVERDSEILFQLEDELSGIQRRIAGLEAETASMEASVVYSYVSVALYEVIEPVAEEPEPEPSWTERMGEAAKTSLNNFLDFFRGLALFIVAALPVLAAAALIGVPAFMIIRRIRRRGISKAGVKATPGESEA